MLRCCRERAIIPFGTPASDQFLAYLNIYIIAQILNTVCLKNDIYIRLNSLAQADFQSIDDVNSLYSAFPKRHPLRVMIAKGAADCFFKGKFGKTGKTYPEYFYKIAEDFEDDVRRFFRQGMAEWDPEWEEKRKFYEAQKGLHVYKQFEDQEAEK